MYAAKIQNFQIRKKKTFFCIFFDKSSTSIKINTIKSSRTRPKYLMRRFCNVNVKNRYLMLLANSFT